MRKRVTRRSQTNFRNRSREIPQKRPPRKIVASHVVAGVDAADVGVGIVEMADRRPREAMLRWIRMLKSPSNRQPKPLRRMEMGRLSLGRNVGRADDVDAAAARKLPMSQFEKSPIRR
tara:strand:+ start:174 stop:527 length:354 start_codon:yes stop_codon:yes gene_type:complete